MYEKDSAACCKGEQKQTETQRILDKFDYKIEMLEKTTSVIIDKVTTLGGFEKLEAKSCDAIKPAQQSNSFISELDVRLEKLQKLLDAQDAIRYNLENLV